MAEVTRKGFKDKNGNKVSLIAKVINAITGHFAGLNNKGEVVDSGYGPSDFAEASHSHDTISSTESDGSSAKVKAGLDVLTHEGYVEIELKNDQTQEGTTKTAQITMDNIDNLARALQNPAAPASGGNKLITNGQVYDALLNAGSIAQVNLKSTVVKDNSSYTYFGVKYGSSTEEENWPEGDPEGVYGQLRLALGETGNTVIPFELTVKNGSDVVQAVVLGFVYYTKTSYTIEGNTSYNHNYKFCIGSFVYNLDISEYHGHFDFPTDAFVGNNSVNSL